MLHIDLARGANVMASIFGDFGQFSATKIGGLKNVSIHFRLNSSNLKQNCQFFPLFPRKYFKS
jgi:hypothetical protein